MDNKDNFQSIIQHAQESSRHALDELQSCQIDDHDGLHSLHLLLQYRLDLMDVLSQLFQFQQSLWQLLGISSKDSPSHNLERLAYALGHDDLKLLLAMQHQLISALLKLLGRKFQQKPGLTHQGVYRKLTKVIQYNHQFKDAIKQLALDLPKKGMVLTDYQARLQGPISEFYQAIQHGLILSASLTQQLAPKLSLAPEINVLMSTSHALFHPVKPMNQDVLEQRAEKRRLGHFFK